MKNLPINISTFSRLINENYLYVDKTEQIYNIFDEGRCYHFLSRPRRFGKSLIITMLKELFSGNKELFKDLYIEKTDWPWLEHPVIHLDFGTLDYDTPQALTSSLMGELSKIGRQYNIDLTEYQTIKAKLKYLVEELAKKNKVALLIDEYDKPILDNIEDIKLAKSIQKTLKSFYDGIKGLDAHLRAIFITGVSKFAKTSIFSGLNNLNDLSQDPLAATLTGYTEEELRTNFTNYLNVLSIEEKMLLEPLMKEIKTWYNGYQFSKKPIKVYNPFSITYLLSKKEFNNYWFETGTPTFLVKLLQKKKIEFKNFQDIDFSMSTLGTFDIEKLPFITLLYQTGYLTISEYNVKDDFCQLTYPNREIKESFLLLELGVSTHLEEDEASSAIRIMTKALKNKNLTVFFNALRALFANIPHQLHVDNEAYYHSLFQLMGTLIGFRLQSEVTTSKGSIDVVIITEKYVYIMEFKFNKTATEAMKQIQDRRYYEKYLASDKEIILIGVSFDYKDKMLEIDWLSLPVL